MRKWRPSMWFVLAGAVAVPLTLCALGYATLRLFSGILGYQTTLILVLTLIAVLTALLWWLLLRLFLRPITQLSAYAHQMRQPGASVVEPPRHYGTQELHAMGQSVINMANTLQNRETTIRSFTDHVTHEIKTPVTAVAAACELLNTSPSLSAEDRDLVAQIQGANEQMHRQLQALHLVAKAREATYHGQTMLAQLAEPLTQSFPDLALSVSGGTVPLPLSQDGITMILDHLLGNARKHKASAASLSVDTHTEKTTLTITDNGTGISPGNATRIFDPFFTTRRDTGGTGMGLTIVANLLRAHGADITLDPSAQDTTFILTFPAP